MLGLLIFLHFHQAISQTVPPELKNMFDVQPFLTSCPDVKTNPESIGRFFTMPIYKQLQGNNQFGYRLNEGFQFKGINVKAVSVTSIKGLEAYAPMLKRALAMTLINEEIITTKGTQTLTVKVVGVEPGPKKIPGLAVELVATDAKKEHAFYLRLGTGSKKGLPRAMVNISILIAGALRNCK